MGESVPSLDDILNVQKERLEELKVATVLLQDKETVAGDLIALQNEIPGIISAFESMRDDLETIKARNEDMKRMMRLLDRMNADISHMEVNIPPQLLQDYAKLRTSDGVTGSTTSLVPSACTSRASEDDEQTNGMQGCKKILFKEQDKYPQIMTLGDAEFRSIPKYLIGRQSLETINNFVGTLNDVLKAKYGVIALGKVGARKKGMLDSYLAYKKQEFALCKERGNLHCFTASDYEQETKSKLDKSKLNLLTVLRHCKRLREVRTGTTIHYAVLTES